MDKTINYTPYKDAFIEELYVKTILVVVLYYNAPKLKTCTWDKIYVQYRLL